MPNFLTERLGPLPTWVWMLTLTMLAGGWVWYKKSKQNKTDALNQQAQQLAADQAATTSAAAPYQPYTVPYVSSSMSYGNGYNGMRRSPAGPPQWQPPQQWSGGGAPAQGSTPGGGLGTPSGQASRHVMSTSAGSPGGGKIVGSPGHYGLVAGGAYNSLGSGVTSLSQADSRAQQYGY